jgi:ABC-type molybdenum transport system ATPase subunit/photorepair protein PhrA
LRPQDEIPHWITHLLVIANGNQIVFQDTREAAHEFFKQWKALHQPGRDPLTQEQDRKQILDQNFFVDVGLSESNFAEKWTGALPMQGEPLVEMEGVQVRYGDKTVLGDWRQNVNGEEKDGLHWKVRRGQSWAILGANGSGKSTLLSLITSDHPQAYALPIQLFGRSRLPEPGKPAISLFDLQSRLGHSSPEVHAFFPRQLSIRQALESAWADTFLSKPVLNLERDRDVEELLRFFRSDLGPKSHAKAKSGTTRSKKMSAALRTQFPPLDLWEMSQQELLLWADEDLRWADEVLFSALTTEQQRLVLFLRTIVHRPDLIILDEAFSGMSASLRQKCFHLLQSGVAGRDSNGSNGSNESISPFSAGPFLTDQQSLIIVSHLKEEVPDFVRFWMRLPSDVGLDNTLPFAMGTLSEDMFISRGQTWDQLWALKKPREDASRALPRTSSRWSSL